MKRLLLLTTVTVLLLSVVGFTSCANKERCWEIEVSFLGKTNSTYLWGTENDVDAFIDFTKAQMAAEAENEDDPSLAAMLDFIKINKKKSKFSEKDCKAKMNEGDFDFF